MVFYFSQERILFVIFLVLQIWRIEPKISSFARQQQTFYTTMDATVCRTIPGLAKSQKKLCYEQPEAVVAAMQGLQQAVQECQYQFSDNRWNCSSLATRTRNPYNSIIMKKDNTMQTNKPIPETNLLSTLVQCQPRTDQVTYFRKQSADLTTCDGTVTFKIIDDKGYKETAFAHAITSAGITLAIARKCSLGLIANCGCDSKIYKIRKPPAELQPKTTFKWGGCSHNIRFGNRFSKWFLDSIERGGDIQSKINLHNNQVGRKTVATNMEIKCKCHGMSGSCELKTCWRAVPDLRVVGNILRQKFDSATLVDQMNLVKTNRQFNMINPKKKKQNRRGTQWSPRKNNKRKKDLVLDLLFYQKSPNFCENNTALDIAGTAGRLCNRTSTGYDSCGSLCCGRGYDLIKKKIVGRCNCTFIYCCEVKCDSCSHEEWISICK